MRENAISFGKTATLLGVLAEPVDRVVSGNRPAVILLNSGILHRVGACRTYVRIARRLARSGMTALRFDFSGIGDSPARRDSLAFDVSSVVEVREAMDYLQKRRGFKRFVLIGLCSGADVGFETAVADSRVVGLMQIDAYAYQTFRHYLVHYGPRVLSVGPWINFARRLLGRNRPPQESSTDPNQTDTPEYIRVFPAKGVVQEKLKQLAARRVEQFYIYTGGQEEYNYAEQFRDSHRGVKFGNTLRVRYIPTADHIITRLENQTEVIDSIDSWAQDCWQTATALSA